MSITNNIHNMGGVRNTTSTDNAEKTPARNSPYKAHFKLFNSQFNKNVCDAINRFGTEKLSDTWNEFHHTNKEQALDLALNLTHAFVTDMFDRAESAFSKQWKKRM